MINAEYNLFHLRFIMTGRKSFTFQRTIIIIILVLFTFSLQAQQANQIFNGSISGRIIDSLSRVPVEFATISIFYQENGKLINGTSSDSKGEFELSGLDNGTYKIVINFIGYQTYSKSNTWLSWEIFFLRSFQQLCRKLRLLP